MNNHIFFKFAGDSGSPLMILKNGKFVHVGLTSFSLSDCSAPFPAVYSRTTYYLDWIMAAITNVPWLKLLMNFLNLVIWVTCKQNNFREESFLLIALSSILTLITYRTRAIITRGLYFIFHCGLYSREIYIAEQLVLQGNFSEPWFFLKFI